MLSDVMSAETIEQWMSERDLDQTKAAAIFNISFPTLGNALRGARLSEESYQKIKDGMAGYDSKGPEKKRRAS